MKDDKDRKAPAALKIMGAVVIVAVIWMYAMAYRSIRDGTKTGWIWHDTVGAEGPWTAVERFVDEHLFGWSQADMDGTPRNGSQSSSDNPFD